MLREARLRTPSALEEPGRSHTASPLPSTLCPQPLRRAALTTGPAAAAGRTGSARLGWAPAAAGGSAAPARPHASPPSRLPAEGPGPGAAGRAGPSLPRTSARRPAAGATGRGEPRGRRGGRSRPGQPSAPLGRTGPLGARSPDKMAVASRGPAPPGVSSARAEPPTPPPAPSCCPSVPP